MRLVVSVCPPVCPFVFLSACPSSPVYPQDWRQQKPLPIQRICLCVCNQGAFVDNLTDVVDQLLIENTFTVVKQFSEALGSIYHKFDFCRSVLICIEIIYPTCLEIMTGGCFFK